jgi:hypothetical protein
MAKAYKANYHAAIMEQGMGICLAEIMTCVGLKLRVTQRKKKKKKRSWWGGIKKKLPFR